MADLIETIPAEKRAAARELDALFREVKGWQPRLWRTVIGYGVYTYRRKGDPKEHEFLATGFNMRARDVALHSLPGYRDDADVAARLGTHKRGKSCWYIKSLTAVDRDAVADLIRAGLADLQEVAEVRAT